MNSSPCSTKQNWRISISFSSLASSFLRDAFDGVFHSIDGPSSVARGSWTRNYRSPASEIQARREITVSGRRWSKVLPVWDDADWQGPTRSARRSLAHSHLFYSLSRSMSYCFEERTKECSMQAWFGREIPVGNSYSLTDFFVDFSIFDEIDLIRYQIASFHIQSSLKRNTSFSMRNDWKGRRNELVRSFDWSIQSDEMIRCWSHRKPGRMLSSMCSNLYQWFENFVDLPCP